MMNKTARYTAAVLIAYLALAAVLLVALFNDWIDSMGFLLFQYGALIVGIGVQRMSISETLDIETLENFFIWKRNLEYYDLRRIVKDRGKAMIVMGAVSLVGASFYCLTGEVHTFSFSSVTYFEGMREIFYGTILAMLIILLVFLIVCRRSKYLKDPSVTPPKKDRL